MMVTQDVPALLAALEAAQAEVARLRSELSLNVGMVGKLSNAYAESVPRSALVQGVAHCDFCSMRPMPDPAEPVEWGRESCPVGCCVTVYAVRTEGDPDV